MQDGLTDERKDGRTNGRKPIYPPKTSLCMGIMRPGEDEPMAPVGSKAITWTNANILIIIIWTIRNKLEWNFNKKSRDFHSRKGLLDDEDLTSSTPYGRFPMNRRLAFHFSRGLTLGYWSFSGRTEKNKKNNWTYLTYRVNYQLNHYSAWIRNFSQSNINHGYIDG